GVFSPDGATIATVSADGTARLWNTAGTLVKVLGGHEGPVRDVSFAPAGCAKLATAGDDGSVRVWSATTGTAQSTYAAHGGAALRVAFLDQRRIASAGADGYVRIFSICQREQLRAICEMRDPEAHEPCPSEEVEECCP